MKRSCYEPPDASGRQLRDVLAAIARDLLELSKQDPSEVDRPVIESLAQSSSKLVAALSSHHEPQTPVAAAMPLPWLRLVPEAIELPTVPAHLPHSVDEIVGEVVLEWQRTSRRIRTPGTSLRRVDRPRRRP